MIGPAYDKDDLKRRAPIALIAAELGVRTSHDGCGLCPFHDDHDPSFYLYTNDDGFQRFVCYPCGAHGDVIDLVQSLKGVSYGEALRYIAEITRDAPSESTRQAPERAQLDRAALTAWVSSARARVAEPESDGWLSVAVGLSESRDTALDSVLRGLGWGVDERGSAVIPHWSPSGVLTGAKVRSLDGAKWAFPGSRFDHLYGSWLPRGSSGRVVLTEGETDFAFAVSTLGGEADTRGLPAGAGKKLDPWVDSLYWFDEVYLGLDNDGAGRTATERWARDLRDQRPERPVFVLQIPDEHDLKAYGVRVTDLLREARRVV